MCKPSQYFLYLVFLIATVSGTNLFAQDFSGHNWYFGNTTRAIRFGRSDNLPTLLNNKVALGTGGSAVASDQINGNLLFYTNGVRVFDATNTQMPNGDLLLGDPTQNQPVVITKVPGVPNQFYIFHRDAAGAVRVTTVDMTQFGNAVFPSPASGNVTTKNVVMAGLTGRSEAMIAIPRPGTEDFWLITHVAGLPDYTVTLVTAGGVFTNTAVPGIGLIESAANFSYHELSGKIAVSPKEARRDVEILSFDNAAGTLLFDQRVLTTGTNTAASGQAIYDTEWSNSGQYLYISRHGEAGIQADVLQFDTRNPSTSLASVLPQPNTISRSYGIQMAPDSLMYHLYQATAGGPFFLGALSNTDTIASVVAYDPQAFAGTINFNATQFPSFGANKINVTLSFTTSGTCSNAPTNFYPTVIPAADSLVWDFGDGSPPVAGWSPVHTYTTGSSFPVTVTAFLNGQASTPVTQNVTITQFDLQITLVQDTTACSCELPLPKAVPPPAFCGQFTVTAQIQGSGTIQWFGPTGLLPTQTTATLSPQEAGYYFIKVQDAATSCFAYAGVNIKEYGIQDQRANIWHFGQNAGIDFNPLFDNPPTAAVAINGPLNAPEGTSVISDRNGQVIISTDGQNIFDRTGTNITPVPNPPGLGGEPGATQSALIVPVPDDETLFYIFTTQEVQGTNTYELRYSLYDLKIGTTGAIVESNQLLFTKSTERITSNGNWLIAHEYGNNSFRAYRITALGISNPVISSIGSDHSFSIAENGQGYMEIGGNSQLAVALSNPGVSNVVEIFDFVDSSGVVTNFRSVDLKTPAGQVYGLEFNGGKLFASIKTAGSSPIIEIFFDAQNIPHKVRQTPPMTVAGEAGAIQVGPDGQIYVAINNSTSLGTIQVNADTTLVSVFTQNGFPLLSGTKSLLGLPNFIQIISNPIQGPDITVLGTCEDDSVTFVGTPTDPIDVFFWQIRTTSGTVLATSDSATFKVFFPDPGTYEAVMRLTNRCGLNVTITEAFEIFAKPSLPNFLPPGGQPVICSTTLQLEGHPVDDPALTYLWSTGETTRVINVSTQGQYSVTVTATNGCTSDGSLIVADNRPIVNLGPDITVCQNVTLADLDAQNPTAGTLYAWTINGAAAGSGQTQPVDSSVPGVFNYAVTVTSPGGPGFGCVAQASKAFTFNESPNFTVTSTNPSSCVINDGQIRVDFLTPTNTLFTYSILGPGSPFTGTDQTPGSFATTTATLAPGTYAITVADQVTSCASQTTAAVTNNAFTITNVARQNTCNPVNLVVTHTAVGPFTYQVFDATTGVQVAIGGPTTGSPFTIPNVNAGTYRITMVSGGCTFTSPPQPVTQDPLATITGFTTNGCTDPVTATVNGAPAGAVFTWTGPGIVGGANTATVSADPPQGPQNYSVHITAAGVCPLDAPVTINVNNDVNADFTQTDPCANQVTLEASPTGSYTYRWFRAGVQVTGGQQLIVPLADNGISYRVEVVNAVSGCVFVSTDKPVLVAGVVTVQTIFPTPIPCEATPFQINTVVNQPGATFEWFRNGTIISGQIGASLIDSRDGLYTVEATVAGCTVPASINIVPAPADPGKLVDNALICPDLANPNPATRQVTLDPGAGFQSYDWFKDEVTLGVTTQTFTANEEGLYSVDLVNVFGCHSSDKTQVDIECDPRIVAPTAFRPASGEEANKAFEVLTFFIDDAGFQVFVFNRWGEMVFQSTDRLFKWNGGYNNNNGQLLPAGTYSYVVKYKSVYRPEDGIKEKRGGVLLVR